MDKVNYLIQGGKLRSHVMNVPEGLSELLSDITREVLRCQPTTDCLCQFVIDYLNSVIATRDKARMAQRIIDRALGTVDEVIADICICNLDKVKSDQMCLAMEDCFKRFIAQRRCEKGKTIELLKFNEIDILDELIQKCKFSEKELKTSRPVIEAAYQKFVDAYMTAQENSEGTEALYQYFRDREMERVETRMRTEAAVKIQSNFRGFLVRHSMFLNKEVEKPAEETSLSSEAEQERAARTIQKFFRAHLSFVKKHMDGSCSVMHDGCEPESVVSLTPHAPGSNIIKEEQHAAEEFEQEFDHSVVSQPVEGQPDQGHDELHAIDVDELAHTEPQPDHHDTEDNANYTYAETTEVHTEVIVDGEVVHSHHETLDDGNTHQNENDQNENAENENAAD